jgi:hypothetical protein
MNLRRTTIYRQSKKIKTTMNQSMNRGRQNKQPNLKGVLKGLLLGLLVSVGLAGNSFAATAAATNDDQTMPDGMMQPTPAVAATIATNEQAFLNAVLAQNNAALEALLHPDFVYVHENGLVSTRAEFLTNFVAKGYGAVGLKQKEPVRQYGGTVFTVSTGYLQLKGEKTWPATTVTHIWIEQDGKWLLVHRHESHNGKPIGEQLSQKGGPNLTGDLGSKPSPELRKVITEREASWVYSMLTSDEARMDGLLGKSLRYIHDTAHTSDTADFMRELRGGYTDTYFLNPTMRQFGDTVIVLHRAQYRHAGRPEQSMVEAMHAWVKWNGQWVLVGRHSTRYSPY